MSPFEETVPSVVTCFLVFPFSTWKMLFMPLGAIILLVPGSSFTPVSSAFQTRVGSSKIDASSLSLKLGMNILTVATLDTPLAA